MFNNKLNFISISVVIAVISLSYSTSCVADINVLNGKGDVFLYGDNVQIGINKNGAFGSKTRSELAPYSVDESLEIGFISDPNGTNFSNPRMFDGDFFMPGIRESGWGIHLDGINYHNTRASNPEGIRTVDEGMGGFKDFESFSETEEVVWTGNIDSKLSIRQTYSIYKKGLVVIIDVELTNSTEAVMNNVYYMQTIDPDNNFQNNNNPTTLNKVIAQGDTDGVAIISASQDRVKQKGRSEVKLIGYGKNIRVAFGGTANRNPIDVYTGTAELKKTGEKTADESISLAVKYDEIAPGETVKFKIAFQLIGGLDSVIPNLTLDANNSSNASVDNDYKTSYVAGAAGTAIPVVDSDLEITKSQSNLMGAEIILATSYDGDVIKLPIGDLPAGITIDAERTTTTKLSLRGEAPVATYKEALKAIRYENTMSAPPSSDERIINIFILDKSYTVSNTAQAFIGVVIPVIIEGDIATDNIVNQTEQTTVKPSGTATPNLDVTLEFIDKNDKKVTATTPANSEGVWNSDAVDISTLADGELTLTAKTTDDNGYISSATKPFKKDTQIDNLVISAPMLNQVIKDKKVTISGTTEPESSVNVKIDANNHCTATASAEGNWSCQVDKLILNKDYPLNVTSTDAAGNEREASSGFKTPPLTLVITAPEDNSMVTGSAPLIVGTSLPRTKITVTAGDKSCTVTATATGNWSCRIVGLPIGGPQSLNIKAEGTDGVTNKTEQIKITVPDKPLVVTSPKNQELIEGAIINVVGISDPKAKVNVSTGVAGESCSATVDNKGDWSCNVQIKQVDETKTLTITSELTGIGKKTETVITKHPSILDVTSPQDKTTVAGTSPLITGKSVPNAAITATVGNKSCTARTSATGSWSCTIKDLPVGGPQKLVVEAKMTTGLKKVAELTISVPEKRLVVTSPQQDELILSEAITTTGTTDPHALVTVSSGETGESCSIKADISGNWSCDFAIKKADETKALIITSELTGIDKKTAAVNVKLPSLLEVSSPKNNTTVAGTSALMTGKSVPNSTITATVGDQTCTAIVSATGEWSCTITDLPVGGPQKLIIEMITPIGLEKSVELTISVPEKPLVVTSPKQDELILSETITTTGTTDPHALVTVSSDGTGESCSVKADINGDWSCDFAIKKADKTKALIITSKLMGVDEKIAAVNVKLPLLLEVTSPKNNSTVAGTSAFITGKSVPNSTITARVGNKSCTAITSATGEWSCTIKDLPVGGPQTLIVEGKTPAGLKKLAELTISVPEKPLIVTSPQQDELILSNTIAVKGTTDPLASVTVATNIADETCISVADNEGNWECHFEIVEFSETKTLTVRSNLKDIEKIATLNVKLEASGEKENTGASGEKENTEIADEKGNSEVTTVLKGGGSSSPFVLLLMVLNILLMRRFFKK